MPSKGGSKMQFCDLANKAKTMQALCSLSAIAELLVTEVFDVTE